MRAFVIRAGCTSLVKMLDKQNPAGYNRLSICTTDRLFSGFRSGLSPEGLPTFGAFYLPLGFRPVGLAIASHGANYISDA